VNEYASTLSMSCSKVNSGVWTPMWTRSSAGHTCEICRSGYQSACVNRVPMGALGAQADLLRVPLADGTLIATPGIPSDDLVPSLLSASDVLGTGWFGAVAAGAGPGKTVAVSATARSGCSPFWRPSSSEPSGSSR
jgi:threonine dehydrogenase-like Zn-dependent dehydrogenase